MDKVTARELELFINNDADLHRQQHVPILKNLMAKHGRGQYDHAKAATLFKYLVDNGAKKYAKEHGSAGAKWHAMFPVPERKHVAQALRDDFEDEAALGNYDEYIPKKYKGKVSGKTIKEGHEPQGDEQVEAEGGPLFDGETRQALQETAGAIDEAKPKLYSEIVFTDDNGRSVGRKSIKPAPRDKAMPALFRALKAEIASDPYTYGAHLSK